MTTFKLDLDIAKLRAANRKPSVLDPAPPPGSVTGYTRDRFVPLQLVDGSTPVIRDIGNPCTALALHGHLPPGVFALAVPYDLRGALVNYLAITDSRDQWAWAGQLFDDTQPLAITLPEEIIVLYPGDVVPLGRRSASGVSVWVSTGPFNVPAYGTGSSNRMLTPEPYIRIFDTDGPLPPRMSWRPIPYRKHIEQVNTDATPPGNATVGGAVFWGCTHARITFLDDDGASRVQAGETGSFDVWWMNSRGLWVHHEADDFDATAGARGAVSDSHYVETYELPVGTIGAFVTRTAGANNLDHIIEGFDLQGGYRP